ncbi:ribonucleoside-diphosphate reductase, partial [Candidatus Micrarchaeota archaeon]
MGVEEHPQCSACQPYYARVNTVDGLIPIGEIVEKNLVGLPVYDANGLTQIVAVKNNGRKQVYRIRLNDGFYVDATADHVVCAHDERRTFSLEWKPVSELKPGMKMRVYPHVKTVTRQATEREVAEAALAGWLQTDGFVGKYEQGTNRSLTIEFITANDEEHEWVSSNLRIVFPTHHAKVREVEAKDKSLKVRRIRLYGEELRPFVEKYDLLKRGRGVRVPESIWTAPNDAVAAYLKSIFQAEGYASTHGRSAHIAFAMISKEFVEDVQVLMTRLGLYSRIRRKIELREDRHDTFELDVSIRSEREKFLNEVGFVSSGKSTALMQSITVTGKECPEIRFSEILSIEPLGEMQVYDIQTQSGNYLSNSVLVHNCFINSVKDSMKSILELAVTEGMLFKFGSGAGTNLSSLRSSMEQVKGGGRASGPVSFMKGYDAFAGVIKSGGKTRRAAKMQILNVDHPDIEEFVNCKWKEEKKAWALIEAGYDGSFGGEAYDSVFFQNANLSVRVTDEFMHAVEKDREFSTRYVTTGEVAKTYKARELMDMIAEAAWLCGDPGMQFDTTVNKWNPVLNSGRITSSNPCSEYMFLDNSACNLASLNLLKFADEKGKVDVEKFKHAVEILITAMEIIVGFAGYPTEAIRQNSLDYRPLGIGYANLGALLMLRGLPYDSDEGREHAAAITALLTAQGYITSALIAKRLGPFKHYKKNEEPFLRVIGLHKEHAYKLDEKNVPAELLRAARGAWETALEVGKENGFRNAQISVIAPTGTIGFMMDCDTTGIEPDIALVKYKWMVGGGMMKMVNNTVPGALKNLGYSEEERKSILAYMEEHDTIEGAPELKEEHLPVFDCAFKPAKGKRSIHYMGHVRMMAAVQPFISGAISKTVNMPNEATVKDVANVYMTAWRLGLKAIAIYRDGSKRTQALTTSREKKEVKAKEERVVYRPVRRRLPDERKAITHKFSIAGHEGYLTVGLYEDGSPGEIFIVMAKQGSTISGMMDAFATSVSMALQYGVPLKDLVRKFAHMRFEPAGMTNNKQIRIAKSIVDYIFRWLAVKFLPPDELASVGVNAIEEKEEEKVEV